jgi:hypothetical protein
MSQAALSTKTERFAKEPLLQKTAEKFRRDWRSRVGHSARASLGSLQGASLARLASEEAMRRPRALFLKNHIGGAEYGRSATKGEEADAGSAATRTANATWLSQAETISQIRSNILSMLLVLTVISKTVSPMPLARPQHEPCQELLRFCPGR